MQASTNATYRLNSGANSSDTDIEANKKPHVVASEEEDGSHETAWWLKAESERSSFTGLWCQTTTSHGFPRVLEVQPKARKIFWLVTTIVAMGIFVYTTTLLVQEYLKFPTSTSLELKSVKTLVFPTVTLCNLNPFKRYSLPGTRFLPNHLQTLYDASGQSFSNFTYDHWEEVEEILYSFPPNETEIESLCYNIDDFLATCEFGGEPCDASNFTTIVNYEYCSCFQWTPTVTHNVDNAGASRSGQKLELLIYVDENEYMPSIGDTSGIRGSVHARDKIPIPENSGFSVSTGQRAWVGMRQTVISRLSPPFGSCGSGKSFYDGLSIDECKHSKFYDAVLESCNCSHTYFQEFAPTEVNPSLLCSTEDQWACANEMYDAILLDAEAFKDCAVECKETQYRTSISTASWPSNSASELIRADLIDYYVNEEGQNRQDLEDEITDTFFKDNYVRLEFFFEELNFEEITQTQTITLTSLFASIGGNLGLYLGMSALTMFEFAELAYILYTRRILGWSNK